MGPEPVSVLSRALVQPRLHKPIRPVVRAGDLGGHCRSTGSLEGTTALTADLAPPFWAASPSGSSEAASAGAGLRRRAARDRELPGVGVYDSTPAPWCHRRHLRIRGVDLRDSGHPRNVGHTGRGGDPPRTAPPPEPRTPMMRRVPWPQRWRPREPPDARPRAVYQVCRSSTDDSACCTCGVWAPRPALAAGAPGRLCGRGDSRTTSRGQVVGHADGVPTSARSLVAPRGEGAYAAGPGHAIDRLSKSDQG